MDRFKICLIVAVDSNNGISKNGQIPLRIKEYMNYFRDVTTKEYIPNKKNVVIMVKKYIPNNKILRFIRSNQYHSLFNYDSRRINLR